MSDDHCSSAAECRVLAPHRANKPSVADKGTELARLVWNTYVEEVDEIVVVLNGVTLGGTREQLQEGPAWREAYRDEVRPFGLKNYDTLELQRRIFRHGRPTQPHATRAAGARHCEKDVPAVGGS